MFHPILHDELARGIEVDPFTAGLAERAVGFHLTGERILLEELAPLRLRLARRVPTLLFPNSGHIICAVLGGLGASTCTACISDRAAR